MKGKLRNVIFTVVCVGFLLSVTFSYLVVKKYVGYRQIHPPTTYSEKDECKIEGLVFHWKFDEINDGVVTDSSGNGISGKSQSFFNQKYLADILYGKPELVEGKDGNSLQFDGKQWITGGNKSCYAIEKFTISLWIWQDNDDIYMPTIMAKSSWHKGSNGYDGWWLCTTPKKRFLDMGIAWGNGRMHVESGYYLPLKEWHHVAVTMNNVDHEVQFFVDGKPYGEKYQNVPNWLVNWNHDLLVAGYEGSGRWGWPGRIDDARFYSTILLPEEIASIYSDTVGR